MAQYVLEILDGDRAGTVVPLSEDPVRIGRKSANDLVLVDEKVSGSHAEVVWEEGRYVLRDLGSTNGTLLDGRPVEEVVLTAQDTFQIGRIRLSFHEEGQEAGGDFRLRRVSAEDLSHSGRSTRWMVGLVGALVLGGGALYYNLYVGPGPIRRSLEAMRGPLEVPRNRLPQGQASCEIQEGWDLRVAGDGFDYGPQAHTGTQGLQAWAVEDGTGFALARLSEGVKVRGSLVVTGYVRTEGSGQIAVRLRFSSSLVDQSQTFTTGMEPRAYGGYERVEWQVAVPPGTDLAEVELLALLPELGDAAFADDLAIVESGDRKPIDLRQGGRVLGTGSSFAVRLSGDPVITGARPLVVDGPLAPVAAAGFATLSDAGVALTVEAGQRAILWGFVGGAGLVLDLPMGSSQGMLARRGDAPFVRLGPTARADEILIGVGTGRVLLELPPAQSVVGATGPGGFQITLPGIDELRIRMSFGEERDLAAEEFDRARAAAKSRPHQALDHLQRILDQYPHDTGKMRQALELKAELVARRTDQIEDLRVRLETAVFFRTRGGFLRVQEELAQLVEDWGEHLDQRESVGVMRDQVVEAIEELDGKSGIAHRERLLTLAGILEDNGQQELAVMVRNYLGRE